MNTFFVARSLLVFVLSSITDAGNPLHNAVFLTPYIKNGQIAQGQKLAEAQPLMGQLKSYAGFFTVDEPTESNMFFWYIPPLISNAQSHEVPVILWLQGGPGVSSLYGAMFLNGPFRLGTDSTLSYNNLTWANHAHMLYIDNPVGTGYSFTVSEEGYSRNETHVGHNLYLTLLQFFQLFPNLQQNPLIIAGESYAGKYLPALGITIHRKNPKADLKLNLQGISIGNGWVDPINMLDFGDILFYDGLLDTRGRKQFNEIRDTVIKYIRAGDLKTAYPIYDQWILGDTTPYPTLYHNLTGLDTYYNYAIIGKPSLEVSVTKKLTEKFFNEQRNGMKLNVGKFKFHMSSKKVARYLRDDILTSVVGWLATLMENYRVLIYSGQLDIKCAFALTENYLNKMEWNGAAAFKKAERQHYLIDGELVGYVKTVGKFTQILIRNSGHMVPRDQARWAEQMIYSFAYNQPFIKKTFP